MLSNDAIAEIRERLNSFGKAGDVPPLLAQRLIEASAWWHGHRQSPTRAPNWAERVTEGPYGLQVEFGGNSFLVERAILLSKGAILQALDQAVKLNSSIDVRALSGQLVNCVRQSVADINGLCDYYQGGSTKKLRRIRRALGTGELYSEGKPIEPLRGFMRFGVQAINVDDFVAAIWKEFNLDSICA